MSKIIAGEVELDLSGETVTLKPTLDAALRIARHFGGLKLAHQRVRDMDLEAVAFVVRAGLSLSDAAAKSLPEKIFAAGLTNLVGPVCDFVAFLANGGRPYAETAGEGETAAGNAG